MADENTISVTIEGMDKVQRALDKFPHEIAKYIGQATEEAAKNLLDTTGLQKYPPAGSYNQPPTPYYIRGRGTQTSSGNKGNSQRLGTQWYVEKKDFSTTIGNRATYATYLHSEKPVYWAQSHGWKMLFSTAKENKSKIKDTIQKWVNKLIKDLGL
jgi:hypothetical protein